MKKQNQNEIFETRVSLNYSKGMTREQAVEAAMRECPDLYFDYVKRLKVGGKDYIDTCLKVNDDALRKAYFNDPELQREFKSVETFFAYQRGVLEGRVRTVKRNR